MAENPAVFNKEASAIYQTMSIGEKDKLKCQVTRRMTKKQVLKDGEKIFKKIQNLVGQESNPNTFSPLLLGPP